MALAVGSRSPSLPGPRTTAECMVRQIKGLWAANGSFKGGFGRIYRMQT